VAAAEQPRARFPWEEEDTASTPDEVPEATETPAETTPEAPPLDAVTAPADNAAAQPGEAEREPLPWEVEPPAEPESSGGRYSTTPPATDQLAEVAPANESEEAVPPEDASTDTPLPWETADSTAPTAPATEPASDVATPSDTMPVEEPSTSLAPDSELPAAPATPPSSEAPPVEDASPAAIDPANHRLNSWLVASKWSLMVLGEHAGAPPEDRSRLLKESEALATALGIELPNASTYRSGQPTVAFVESILPAGRELGVAIGTKHGAEETALVEAALKSNLLLLLGDARPDLIPAVVRSVTAAADRGKLPAEVVQPFANSLGGSPTPEQVQTAVFEFHRTVEENLRAK
jgi:hypothetical protein